VTKNARKLVAGMAAAGGGLILLTTVLFRDEIHDWLFAIRRVRTWGDLLAQRPIRLSDGVIVRLGIEDTRCPQGSGLLLYCLTEGYDPNSRNEITDTLGPLDVLVVEEGANVDGAGLVRDGSVFRPLLEKQAALARLLFAHSIPVPRSGRYRVTLSERGKPLRGVTVKGTDEFTHPWLTLETSQSSVRLPGSTFLSKLVPCEGSTAIPLWLGFQPCVDVDPSRVDAALPLPRLFPDDNTCQLELRREANSLIVTSASQIGFSEKNFAARWWINGMPHVPEAPKSSSGKRRGFRLQRPVEQFRFNLHFAAAPGDLQSGDRVSLQLLYSHQGWSLTDGGEEVFFLFGGQRILLSNRIDLRVP
jgi:hypothetical protein